MEEKNNRKKERKKERKKKGTKKRKKEERRVLNERGETRHSEVSRKNLSNDLSV